MCQSCEDKALGGLLAKNAAQPVVVGSNPSAFVALMAEADDEFRKLVMRYVAGLSPEEFGNGFVQLLMTFHAEAHMIGQQEWGRSIQSLANAEAMQVVRLGKVTQNPRIMETLFMPPEADYVAGLVRQLRAGDDRYFDDDGVKLDDLLGRTRLYQLRMRGTQGAGVLDASPPRSLWKWTLGGAENSCDDCPWLASLVPNTRENWFSTPGSGDTACSIGCKCTLVEVETGISTASWVNRL